MKPLDRNEIMKFIWNWYEQFIWIFSSTFHKKNSHEILMKFIWIFKGSHQNWKLILNSQEIHMTISWWDFIWKRSYEFHMNFSWFIHDVMKLALIHFIFDKSISIYHEFDMNISCAGIWGRVHMKFIWNSYEGSSFMRFSRQSGHSIWIWYEIHELLVFVFAGTGLG